MNTIRVSVAIIWLTAAVMVAGFAASAVGLFADSDPVGGNTFATAARLNLQENDKDMSTAISPMGNIDTNDGATDYFTATSQITSASNDTDWTLVLVLRDKPDVAAPATITVW